MKKYAGYKPFVFDLLEDIYSQVNAETEVTLRNGLCGIASGLSWIIEKQYIEGEVEEVLEDIDKRIMERNPLRMTDYSLDTGLAGILYYVLLRMQYPEHMKIWDQAYLEQLKEAASGVMEDAAKAESLEMAALFLEALEGRLEPGTLPLIPELVNGKEIKAEEIMPGRWGLKQGWAGLGMQWLKWKQNDKTGIG